MTELTARGVDRLPRRLMAASSPWLMAVPNPDRRSTSNSKLEQKTATAVAFVKDGRGLINVNGAPIENVEPELLRYKILEPVLLLNQDTFSKVRSNFACGGVWVGAGWR